MLTMNILQKEQKMTYPSINEIKDFVANNVAKTDRRKFINILDERRGRGGEKPSDSYKIAIDKLFNKLGFVDALTYLKNVMEKEFNAPNIPFLEIENKSDIRSSMLPNAEPVVGKVVGEVAGEVQSPKFNKPKGRRTPKRKPRQAEEV